MKTIDLKIPLQNPNDTSARLVCWTVADGQTVVSGETVAEFETTKSVFELPAEASGRISLCVAENADYDVGTTVARICIDESAPSDVEPVAAMPAPAAVYPMPTVVTTAVATSQSPPVPASTTPQPPAGTTIFSERAAAALAAHNVSREVFAGVSHVREADVLKFIGRFDAAAVSVGPAGRIPIVVYGGGGHSRQCLEIIAQNAHLEAVGIIDTLLPAGTRVLDVPVIGHDKQALADLYARGVRHAVNAVASINNPRLRGTLHQMLKRIGFAIPNLVHVQASVSPSAVLGEGIQIMAGTVVGPCVRIGDSCIVNSGAIVSHDCVLANNAHVAPGAILAGSVRVGENSLIGMGVTVYMNVTIGDNCVIRNGERVFSDVAGQAAA